VSGVGFGLRAPRGHAELRRGFPVGSGQISLFWRPIFGVRKEQRKCRRRLGDSLLDSFYSFDALQRVDGKENLLVNMTFELDSNPTLYWFLIGPRQVLKPP
jgi:hypothetical protein